MLLLIKGKKQKGLKTTLCIHNLMGTISHEACVKYLVDNLNGRLEDAEKPIDAPQVPKSRSKDLLARVANHFRYEQLVEFVTYQLRRPAFDGAYGIASIPSSVNIGTLTFKHYHDGGYYAEPEPTRTTIVLKLNREVRLRDHKIPALLRKIDVDRERMIDHKNIRLSSRIPFAGLLDITGNSEISEKELPSEWFFNPYKS